MRTLRYRLATAAALAVVAGTLFTAEAAPVRCPATSAGIEVMPWSADIRTGEHGGSVIPYTQQDSDWWVQPNDDQTYSVAPHSAWTAAIPNANWINYATTYHTNTAPGWPLPKTTFRTTFQVPPTSFLAQLNLTYAADNGVLFYLNGAPIGGYDPVPTDQSAFQQLHTLTWAGMFKDGVNTLDAVVSDDGEATGVLVAGTATACVPGKVYRSTCVYATPTGLIAYSPKPVDLGTGETSHVPHAFTTVDDDWWTYYPPGPAYSVQPDGAWVTSGTANWINATPTRWSPSPLQFRIYAINFSVPTGFTYADLDLSFATDNTVEFYLNGPAGPIGGYVVPNQTAYNQWHTVFHASLHFVAGTNTLYAVVTDDGASTGLIVEGGAHICPKGPPR